MEYFQFGVCLLDDGGGIRVRGIETFRQSRPNWILSDILHEWLKGRGRRPESWDTLLECLHSTGLSALADNLEHVLGKYRKTLPLQTIKVIKYIQSLLHGCLFIDSHRLHVTWCCGQGRISSCNRPC